MLPSRRSCAALLAAGVLILTAVGEGSAGSLLPPSGGMASNSPSRGMATPTVRGARLIANPIPTDIPLAKQDFLRKQATAQAVIASTSHPIVHAPIPQATSCPIAINPGVIYPFRFGPFSGGQNLVNAVDATDASGWGYSLYAGATDDDATQGVVIVIKNGDSCADPLGNLAYVQSYPTPYRKGAVTITGVQGETIFFSLPDGSTGSFDFVTGQYQ